MEARQQSNFWEMLVTITQREKGQYFTPDNVVQAIIENVVTHLPESRNDNLLLVLDPSVGEGIFCEKIIQVLSEKIGLISIDALDIDSSALSKAKLLVNDAIKSEGCSVTFHHKNYLTESYTETVEKKYDLIISNPPHNAKYSPQEWDKIRKLYHLTIQENVPSESALYFVIKSINLLKDGGILSFILPKPFIYSNKWKLFRKICFTQVRLLEVFDLANQFSGQLQEHIVVILQKKDPSEQYKSGIWDPIKERFTSISVIKTRNAVIFDNFLVGVSPSEQELMEKLLKDHRRVEWIAFRGLNSRYRTSESSIPLIEKVTFTHGFLLPERNYVSKDVPELQLKRFLQPKIITQRIISYKTKPKFQLNLPIWVDSLGNHITHETVINIIPPSSSSNEIYAYAALFQSKLLIWWLQHAVYTKQFVTSKDLDKPYLNKVIIPCLDGDSNPDFRRKIKTLIKRWEVQTLTELLSKESKLDQFFTIGEIFKSYLEEGSKLRELLEGMIIESNILQKSGKNMFKSMKQLDRFFRTKNMSDSLWLTKKFGTNFNKASIKEIFDKYSKMEGFRIIIDEIVFKIYGLSQDETQLIVQGV
ncbi:MAG: N-6 DNA methylase [Candidatus Hodarchaeales archaeon]